MSELIIGREYKIVHNRKGVFRMKLISEGDTWVTGVITSGKTFALNPENSREKGEVQTVRKSFCSFKLIENEKS